MGIKFDACKGCCWSMFCFRKSTVCCFCDLTWRTPNPGFIYQSYPRNPNISGNKTKAWWKSPFLKETCNMLQWIFAGKFLCLKLFLSCLDHGGRIQRNFDRWSFDRSWDSKINSAKVLWLFLLKILSIPSTPNVTLFLAKDDQVKQKLFNSNKQYSPLHFQV